MTQTTQTTQSIRILKVAHKLGYRVTRTGIVIGPNFNVMQIWPCKSPRGGYLMFQIRLDGKKHPIKVHRLQAYQKYGDRIFEKYLEVRHKNNDKRDNTWDNIILGTHSANMMDVPVEIRIKRAQDANLLSKRFSKECIASIRLRREAGLGLTELADEHGVSIQTISDIVNRETYKSY